MDNDLKKYFLKNKGRLITKWMHYFDIYDAHFSRYRGTDVHIVEFGVFQGGSLSMWKHYFGSKCKIYGVDINPECKKFEEENVKIFIGDQEDKSFLKELAKKIPRIDILLDDGGHTMKQQINTFEVLFPKIDDNGVYMCEDLHTSYWSEYYGGYNKKGTFIEYSKSFIDYINAWHSRAINLKVNDFTKSARSLHYYDSILVVEKGKVEKPYSKRTGAISIPDFKLPERDISLIRKILRKIKRKIFK